MKGIVKVKMVLAVFSMIYIFFAGVDAFKWKTAYAQHTDVFNLYQDKVPGKEERMKNVKPDAPEAEWVKVEDNYKYEVSVEKSKYEAKGLTMADRE